MTIATATPIALDSQFGATYAHIDRCLNTAMDEILQTLREHPLPDDLPENPRNLADAHPALHRLVSLYCYCDFSDRNLGDGGLAEMPDTYEDFRTTVFPRLKAEVQF